MKIIKVFGIAIFSIIFIVLCLVFANNIFGYRANIVKSIDGRKIQEVRLGMNFGQVISILGMPYEVKALVGLHDHTCKISKDMLKMSVNENIDIIHIVDSIFNDTVYCCDGNKEELLNRKKFTLIYTKPVFLSEYYPMLWVNFDSNYQVYGVYAKRYEGGLLGLDNKCIYSLYWKYDTQKQVVKNNDVGYYIDEQLFSKCFVKKR